MSNLMRMKPIGYVYYVHAVATGNYAMNKNEHLGSYRLFDKVRFQGTATIKTRCFKCRSVVSNDNHCQYCEPYKLDLSHHSKAERNVKESY